MSTRTMNNAIGRNEKVDQVRMNDLMKKVFFLLNQENVTVDEAILLGEEIMFSAIEKMAKENNLSVEDIQHKMYGNLAQEQQRRSPFDGLEIGSKRGWIGNGVVMTENN